MHTNPDRMMSLSDAAIQYGGTLMYPDCQFDKVSTDTRNLIPGHLFVALRGDNFDAHDFLPQAAQTACGMIVEKPDRHLEIPQWVVPDTTLALGQVARLKRARFDGVLVAVTGSAGKTTVKEMLASIFTQASGKEKVLATRGNLNNHIGVPLTLLNLTAEHRYAVIEMGASGSGEIEYLCQLAQPQVTLVNNVMPAHVAGFGSIDGIAAAKGEIYSGLNASGTAVLNLDERYTDDWRQLIGPRRCLTFSTTRRDADISADNISADALGRCHFLLQTPAGHAPVQLTLSGRHNVANALAAASMAFAVGIELGHIVAGLQGLPQVPGRMELKTLGSGNYVIDDSYNANPGAVKAAVDALLALPGSQHMLVLGDMGELGEDEVAMHADVGQYAATAGVQRLFTVGELSAHSSTAFGSGAQHFDNKQTLIDALLPLMGGGVAVLIKGSRSSGMENIVKALEATSSHSGAGE